MKALWIALQASILCGTFVAVLQAMADERQGSAYIDRPLNLPNLSANSDCPISTGDNNLVSSDHGYIFGAGGYFFGAGPAYLALSWKPRDRAEAYFKLNPRTLTPDGFRLKTPWVMEPSYRGQALIRGVKIGGDSAVEVLFQETTQPEPVTANMVLNSEVPGTIISDKQKNAVEGVWGFWPSSMVLAEPGCYAIQIDTERGSDIVVFDAIAEE